MSLHVVSWVLQNSPATLVDRLVLIVLGDHASKDGSGSYPSQRTLAEEARCSERAVRYALQRLEAAGAITRDGTSEHGTIIWRVLMTAEARAADFAGAADSAPRNDVPPGKSFPEPRQTTTEPGAKSADKPVLNRPEPSEPPKPPASGGRKRDQSAYEEQLRSYAAWLLPDVDPAEAAANVNGALTSGGCTTTAEVLKWLEHWRPDLAAACPRRP